MLIKLYDRGAEGTIKSQYKENLYEDVKSYYGLYAVTSRLNEYELFRYCPHCNSDLYGKWKYYTRSIRWQQFKSKKEAFISGYDLSTFCYFSEDEILKNGKINKKALKEELEKAEIDQIPSWEYASCSYYDKAYHDILNTADLILAYRDEINEFRNMKSCPACGKSLPNDLRYSFSPNLCPTVSMFNKDIENGDKSIDELVANNRGCGTLVGTPSLSSVGYEKELFSVLSQDKRFREAKDGDQIKFDCFVATKIAKGEELQLYEERGVAEERSFESKLNFFRSLRRKEIQDIAENRLEAFENSCDEYVPQTYSQSRLIVAGPNALKEYLGKLISVESGLYAVRERLCQLYVQHFESKMEAHAAKLFAAKAEKKSVDSAMKRYQSLKNEKPEAKISIDDIPCSYPPRPACPVKPTYPPTPIMPQLMKLGLFNKKKAIQYNNEITQRYNLDLQRYQEQKALLSEKYEEKFSIYKEEVRKYEEIVADIDKQRQLDLENKIEEIKAAHCKKIDAAKAKLDKCQAKYDALISDESDFSSPEVLMNRIIEDEISQAELTMRSIVEAKKDLYSCDIVFSKYRNIVALCSMYEYLSAGRCRSLEGTDGAYNIYEAELRMNTVIGQLSQVVSVLEEIKSNQFVIYSTMKDINKQLDALNNSMDCALSQLREIKSNTADIKRHAVNIENNTEISAYYSKQTAYYAKRNAEITGALAFMMAYK